MRSRLCRLWCIPALCLAFGPLALAATGELKGKVLDRSGTPLPGVTVVVRNDALGVTERGGVTNAQGDYRIIALPPGPGYRLRATLPTYASLEFSDLEVPEGAVRIQDIVLQPASELKETVRVEAKGDVVNTESVTTSTSFSSEFIAGLPVLGRDYQDILSLAPGVTDVNDTGNPNIHGARDTDVLTMVDGLNTTDPFSGHYGQQLNIESIQEIEVITSGSRAEFSRAQGGFVNILTKSGSNEFQGSFKFYMRSSRLDQDGAGTDDPELVGGIGDGDFREQKFTDLYPFFSASGAFVRDKLWYLFSAEYVQVETPVNSLTQSFVVGTHGYRVIGKATWQINSANKLAFSVNVDRTMDENQGLTSLTNEESGYFFKRGGPTYALRETAVLGPTTFLESALGWFDNNFQRGPSLNPDTNHNGILSVDDRPDLGGNGDGSIQASEFDPGEDFDADLRYDIFEDQNGNGLLDNIYEDLDFDGRLTEPTQCEGATHEDRNCNGSLDFEEDKNLDGVLQPSEDVGIPCVNPLLCPSGTLPGTLGNGRFDTEDANRSGTLDVVGTAGNTPFPYWVDANQNGSPEPGEFQSPLPADRIYFRDTAGRFTGPNPYEYDDHRTRFTLREDLSFFVSDFGGTHDLKLGGIYEKEGYDSTTIQRPYLRTPRPRTASSLVTSTETFPGALVGFLGVPGEVNNSAEGKNYGFFIQDTYKPLPNLTLGLGVRVDIEDLSSAGYSFFEPASEREIYTGLIEITGVDVSPNGITAVGLCRDPIYNCSGTPTLRVANLNRDIRTQAPQRLTRHNSEVDILGPFLATVLGNDADINQLQALGYNVREPEDIEIQNTNVAPRLSLTWDPWADGKSKAFASWGRFYDKLFLNTMVLEQGPDSVTRFYNFDKDGVDGSGRPDNHFGTIISQSPPSAYQIDRSLSTPYSDEMTFGFQRELAPEISLGITYIQRDFQNQLQDVDVNHYTVRDPATGQLIDQLGEELVAQALGKRNTGAHQPDGVPDLYIQDFFFNRIFRLGNYNNQSYRGVELELVKRLSRKWQMEASYTYSRSEGDAESFLSDNGDDPALTEFEPGYLDYDQTHVVKLNATTFLPADWRLGGTILYASGLPYSFIQETESSDDVGYVQSRRLFGYYHNGFIPENRNIHRNPASYEINVKTEKAFVIGKAAASAFFEIFNLLNTDDLRVYTIDTGVTRLNTDGVRQFGRRFAFGIQINF